MKNFGDIDIDFKNRDDLLALIKHIPASRFDGNVIEKHLTGIYAQNIPVDGITGLASIDYKRAEELGYMKIDFLNLTAYKDISSEAELVSLIEEEPMWELLEHEEIVSQLSHIHDHFDIVNKMKPCTVEQLAMVLALIRPGKRYLVGKPWKEVEKDIWVKGEKDAYSFKKAHALSYAMLIVMQMNQLVRNAE